MIKKSVCLLAALLLTACLFACEDAAKPQESSGADDVSNNEDVSENTAEASSDSFDEYGNYTSGENVTGRYSDENGRVLMELDPEDGEIVISHILMLNGSGGSVCDYLFRDFRTVMPAGDGSDELFEDGVRVLVSSSHPNFARPDSHRYVNRPQDYGYLRDLFKNTVFSDEKIEITENSVIDVRFIEKDKTVLYQVLRDATVIEYSGDKQRFGKLSEEGFMHLLAFSSLYLNTPGRLLLSVVNGNVRGSWVLSYKESYPDYKLTVSHGDLKKEFDVEEALEFANVFFPSKVTTFSFINTDFRLGDKDNVCFFESFTDNGRVCEFYAELTPDGRLCAKYTAFPSATLLSGEQNELAVGYGFEIAMSDQVFDYKGIISSLGE